MINIDYTIYVFDKKITDVNLKISIINNRLIFKFFLDCLYQVPLDSKVFIDICSNKNLIDNIEIYYLNPISYKKTHISMLAFDRKNITNVIREHNLNTILNEH